MYIYIYIYYCLDRCGVRSGDARVSWTARSTELRRADSAAAPALDRTHEVFTHASFACVRRLYAMTRTRCSAHALSHVMRCLSSVAFFA